MTISFKATGLALTPAIENYATEKIQDLKRFFPQKKKEEGTKVFFDLGMTSHHHKKGKIFRAEVNMDIPGSELLRAECEHEDLYAAIDAVKDELHRQIIKNKEKKIQKYHQI